MNFRWRWSGLGLAALLSFGLSGCGGGDTPPLGRVSGTITMGTEPLVGVIVLFKPDEGRPATGTTDAKGYYETEYTQGVRGAKVGPTTVMLEWPLGAKNTKPLAAKYTSKSELKVEVKPGANKFDFNLDADTSKKIIPAD